jgi:hypothetical protein
MFFKVRVVGMVTSDDKEKPFWFHASHPSSRW